MTDKTYREKDTPIQFYVTQDMNQRIETMMEATHRNKSEILRLAIDHLWDKLSPELPTPEYTGEGTA